MASLGGDRTSYPELRKEHCQPHHIFLSALFIHFLHTADRNNKIQLPENFVRHTKAWVYIHLVKTKSGGTEVHVFLRRFFLVFSMQPYLSVMASSILQCFPQINGLL